MVVITCEHTIGGCTFILGVTHRSAIYLADDFILVHNHLWSANNRCLISGGFNAPDFIWTEMATVGSINFDSKFLITVMKHALVQHVSKPSFFFVGLGNRS